MPTEHTTDQASNGPPTMIKLLAIVLNLYGIVRLVSGVFVILLAVNIGIAGDGGPGTRATVLSLVPIGTAVVTFVVVYGLWSLAEWAWFLGIVLAGVQLLRAGMSLFGGELVVYETAIFAALAALLWTNRRYFLNRDTRSTLSI